jgi:hypothetical protein
MSAGTAVGRRYRVELYEGSWSNFVSQILAVADSNADTVMQAVAEGLTPGIWFAKVCSWEIRPAHVPLATAHFRIEVSSGGTEIRKVLR